MGGNGKGKGNGGKDDSQKKYICQHFLFLDYCSFGDRCYGKHVRKEDLAEYQCVRSITVAEECDRRGLPRELWPVTDQTNPNQNQSPSDTGNQPNEKTKTTATNKDKNKKGFPSPKAGGKKGNKNVDPKTQNLKRNTSTVGLSDSEPSEIGEEEAARARVAKLTRDAKMTLLAAPLGLLTTQPALK